MVINSYLGFDKSGNKAQMNNFSKICPINTALTMTFIKKLRCIKRKNVLTISNILKNDLIRAKS
jgi:hypothetical protein